MYLRYVSVLQSFPRLHQNQTEVLVTGSDRDTDQGLREQSEKCSYYVQL